MRTLKEIEEELYITKNGNKFLIGIASLFFIMMIIFSFYGNSLSLKIYNLEN